MSRVRIAVALAAAVLALLGSPARAADAVALLTILEGDGVLIRGGEKLALAEGIRLNDEDLLDTGKSTFAQLEFADGAIVGVGPATRLQVGPKMAKERTARPNRLYLLSGWLKVAPGSRKSAATPLGWAGAGADMLSQSGAVVAMSSPEELQLFVESGDARIVDRLPGANATPIGLRNGEFFLHKGADKAGVAPRPSKDFVDRMPRAYRDSLPARAERFKERPANPKPIGPIAYEDVAGWLAAESAVRRQFLQRWRAKANDKAFRTALIANLPAHMEWDPVLFPEKYKPKPPPTQPTDAGASPRPPGRTY